MNEATMNEADMNDSNPYSAPGAELDNAQDSLYKPKIISFNGRIGRMRYLAYSIGATFLLMLVMMPLIGMSTILGAGMGGDTGMSMLGMLGIAVYYIAAILISVMYAKRRLNDLNRSGWWFLLFIVPVVNLLLAIYLIFFPGTDGANDFGPVPTANSIGVLILGWSMPVLFVLGIVAAIAVPQFAGP
ncbi:MAG: DUF805 domain-containing protein [Gammaproteobacteria bacterium]|jgi:uncharacterized membrane protein YhaH (DUF805 family)